MVVISGGQTGVDQAALFAARAAGLKTGGFAPKGWLTENGCEPWLADYGLMECDEPGYPARTARNVLDSDGTLWLGNPGSPGGKATLAVADRNDKPVLLVSAHYTGAVFGQHTVQPADVELVVLWLLTNGIKVLNVAGTRESRSPGVGAAAEKFLGRVFLAWKERVDDVRESVRGNRRDGSRAGAGGDAVPLASRD